MNEALLEPLLRKMRIRRVIPVLRHYDSCRLLDVGSGFNYRLLRSVEPYISEGWGIDKKGPELEQGKLRLIRSPLGDRLPFEDDFFDVVTMLAVLEHLDDPATVAGEIVRVLRPGGRLVITVPSTKAKPVLEFLAFKVGIVSREEIADHKRYYTQQDLVDFIHGFERFEVEACWPFQMGFNTACVALKR